MRKTISAFRNDRADVVCVETGLSSFGMWLLWAIVSKGQTNLGEESVAKVEHIFRRGYRRVFWGGKGHRKCGEEGVGSAIHDFDKKVVREKEF